MNESSEDLEKLRSRVRFRIRYEMGFYCADVDDIVQEVLTRYLIASRQDKIQNPAAVGAFLNGVSRNVISEFRRRTMRDDPMPEVTPEPPSRGIADADLFEIRQAIRHGMEYLSDRDRRVLTAYYLEEKSKEEILQATGISDENFRVVLCRARERFRAIYLELAKHRRDSRHSTV